VAAWGPPPAVPWWPQGSTKYVLAATNPIWLDGDGDGKFTSALAYAEALLAKHAPLDAALGTAVGAFDAAIVLETASLLRTRAALDLQAAYEDARSAAERRLEAPLSITGPTAERIREYLRAAPPIDVRTRRERLEEAAEAEREAKKDQSKVEEAPKPTPPEEGDPSEDKARP
jgi:hypothetical protein